MDDDAITVILQAERIIYRAGWRLLEERWQASPARAGCAPCAAGTPV
jgi:hypothetical protein